MATRNSKFNTDDRDETNHLINNEESTSMFTEENVVNKVHLNDSIFDGQVAKYLHF